MEEKDVKPYKNQVYEELKSKHLRNGKLFIDNEFPPNYSSLVRFKNPPYDVVWRRPKDIVRNPQFFVDGTDPNDIDQGQIGDCWFIAGAIAIAAYPEYLEKVVPNDQSFDRDYCGIFHFRFWKFGVWYDVVIDDLLPVNRNNELIYCSNKRTKNEFWASLLEKAYAKLNTCYEFLDGGFTHDSMIDMTGGINENFDLHEMRLNSADINNLWKILNRAYSMKSLIGASIYGNGTESIKYNGLVQGHAYSVLKLLEFTPNYSTRNVRLIRIKNPWKNGIEWNGRFSDYSSDWYHAPYHIKQEIGELRLDDGEFWMPFEEFLQQFSNLSIVHVDINAFYNEEYLKRKNFKWKCASYHDEWIAGINSGGYGYIYQNPQYLINIKDIDLNDNDDTCTLIVSLIQKESIRMRTNNYGKVNDEPIHFKVFKLLNERYNNTENQGEHKFGPYDLQFVGDSGAYTPFRVVSKRFKLPPGSYVIIPSTYRANINLKYLIRLYTEFELNDKRKNNTNRNQENLNKFKNHFTNPYSDLSSISDFELNDKRKNNMNRNQENLNKFNNFFINNNSDLSSISDLSWLSEEIYIKPKNDQYKKYIDLFDKFGKTLCKKVINKIPKPKIYTWNDGNLVGLGIGFIY